MKIHHIIINPRENGLFIKNCANNIAIYDNCGHGSHGKMDPIMPITHIIIQVIQQAMSIYYFVYYTIKHLEYCFYVGKK